MLLNLDPTFDSINQDFYFINLILITIFFPKRFARLLFLKYFKHGLSF
jgi:hypothetical protein